MSKTERVPANDRTGASHAVEDSANLLARTSDPVQMDMAYITPAVQARFQLGATVPSVLAGHRGCICQQGHPSAVDHG